MAFIGIKVPKECGKLLSAIEVPGKRESASEYHITLLYFGEDWKIAEVRKAMEAAYEALGDFKPFSVKADTVSCFPTKEGNPYPVIVPVKSEKLHELNEKLRKKFDDADVEYSKLHKEYKPHITLSYSKKKVDKFEIDPVEFMVSEIILWAGDHWDDRLFVTFPLEGNKKTAFLEQKASLFEKMAGREEGILRKTKERRGLTREEG